MEVQQNLLVKKSTRVDVNRAGQISKIRVEAASSNTDTKMSESACKISKRCFDHPKYGFKLTCIIHGPGHSSDECKVLGDFGSKYAKIGLPSTLFTLSQIETYFNGQKDNNDIFNYAVDEIVLQENNKVSVEQEAHESIESGIDEKDLCHIDNMSLDDKKENPE